MNGMPSEKESSYEARTPVSFWCIIIILKKYLWARIWTQISSSVCFHMLYPDKFTGPG